MEYVIASHNSGKIKEMSRIVKSLGIEIVNRELTEAEENGITFMENAIIKAKSACDETGLPAIADDSGLCVNALGGEPGVYSARYAEPGKRRITVLKKLEGLEDRSAYFVSAIACVFPNGDMVTAEGICNGEITTENRGEGGFGYDPIFLVGDKTFAEMNDEEKDKISHRGKALNVFKENLGEYLNNKEK